MSCCSSCAYDVNSVASLRTFLARPTSSWPAWVSVRRRLERTNSVVCRASSTARIWVLAADWLICSRSAARVRCCSSATATKVRN